MRWYHGFPASITWDLHLIEALGVKLLDVQSIFVSMMITIGIGRYSTYHSNVYRRNCMRWLSRDRVSSTLANGLYLVFLFPFSFFFLLHFPTNISIQLFFVCDFSGVHHKKKNCESNQVISKVQQVLRIATKSHQLYPKTLTLTVASVVKKSKLRKGNGGWSDVRDHNLCLNVTWASNYWYWSKHIQNPNGSPN